MTFSKFVLAPALLLLAGSAAAGTMSVPQDFATIQDAVTAALPGDVIVISSGLYRENILITTSGLTLKGKKVVIDGGYLGSCMTVEADDVSISGIVFANGGPAEGKEGTSGGGLLVTGSGASIVKCEFRGNVDFGLSLIGTGEIQDSLVVATLGPGLLLDSGDSAGPLTTVRHNSILRNASGIEAGKGPFLFDLNLIANNTGDGLHVAILVGDGSGPASDPTEIKRNTLTGNGGTAVLLVDEIGSTTLIEKNDIDENGVGLDLTASDLTVSKNDIDLSRTVGAWLRTTGMTWDANKMRRSTLAGAVIQTAPGLQDGQNTFTASHFQTSGGDGAIVESSLNVFEDCLFSDNQGDGLSIVGGTPGNQVLTGTSRNNGHDGFDNSGVDTLFTGNKSKDNLGADLAGIGDGTGTVDAASTGNTAKDGTDLTSPQELELVTLP